MDRQKRAQEHYCDIKFCVLESFPFQEDKASVSCLSMLSVCPLASSIEPVDRFSWYKNLIYMKVAPTPHCKFYFPSISNNKMADSKFVLALGIRSTKMMVRDSENNAVLL